MTGGWAYGTAGGAAKGIVADCCASAADGTKASPLAAIHCGSGLETATGGRKGDAGVYGTLHRGGCYAAEDRGGRGRSPRCRAIPESQTKKEQMPASVKSSATVGRTTDGGRRGRLTVQSIKDRPAQVSNHIQQRYGDC